MFYGRWLVEVDFSFGTSLGGSMRHICLMDVPDWYIFWVFVMV